MQSIDRTWFEPKGFGQIITSGLKACFSGGAAPYVAAAVCFIPAVIAQFVAAYLMGDMGVAEMQAQLKAGTLDPTTVDPMVSIKAQLVNLGSTVVFVIACYFAGAACARTIAERVVGKAARAFSTWDFLMGSAFLLPGVAALVGVAMSTGGGVAALQSPPVLAYVAFGLVTGLPLMAVITYVFLMPMITGTESSGTFASVGRSFALIKGNFFLSFGIMLVASIVCGGVISLAGWAGPKLLLESLQASMGQGLGMAVASLPQIILLAVVTPIEYAVFTALYLHLRAKNSEEPFSPRELAIDVGYELPASEAVEGASLPESPVAADDASEPNSSS